MNEEEKEAIDKLQYTIEINQNILDGIEIDEQVIKSMETTLKLIEKQQKEIKARLEEIDSLYKMMSAKDDEIETLKESQLVLYGQKGEIVGVLKYTDDVIRKDKIKEKIKEVENREENYTFDKLTSEDIRRTIITNLEELLGETND